MWRAVGERSLDCSASGRKNLRAHSVGRRSDALLGWGVVRAISIASASVSGRRSGSLSQDAFHTGRPGRRRGMLTCGFDGSGSDAFRAVATDRHEADGPQRQKVADPGYSARRVRRHFADTQDLILTGRFVASSSENRSAPLGHLLPAATGSFHALGASGPRGTASGARTRALACVGSLRFSQHGQAEARDGAVHLLLHPRTLPTFLILRLDRRTRSHS